MATQTLYADTSITGNVATPDNVFGAPDAVWTTTTGNNNWTYRWGMQNPTGGATPTGTQTITVRAKKEAGQTGTPTIALNLYENGSLVTSLLAATNVTSGTGADFSGTFSGASISDPTAVEIQVVTVSAGGSPGVRTAVQVDAITWTGDFFVAYTQSPADPENITDSLAFEFNESNSDNLGLTDSLVYEIDKLWFGDDSIGTDPGTAFSVEKSLTNVSTNTGATHVASIAAGATNQPAFAYRSLGAANSAGGWPPQGWTVGLVVAGVAAGVSFRVDLARYDVNGNYLGPSATVGSGLTAAGTYILPLDDFINVNTFSFDASDTIAVEIYASNSAGSPGNLTIEWSDPRSRISNPWLSPLNPPTIVNITDNEGITDTSTTALTMSRTQLDDAQLSDAASPQNAQQSGFWIWDYVGRVG